jgi:ABC-type amino acid transport substrate-binding protein
VSLLLSAQASESVKISSDSSNAAEIKIISFYDDATNPEYKGPMTTQYLKLNERVMDIANLNYSLEMATIYEARAIFSRGSVDVHFPGICEVTRQRQVVYSEPVLNFDRYLIAMGDQPVPENLDRLRGKTLGLVHRFIYQLPSARELGSMNVRLFHAKSIAANVRMLLNGRVDVILAPLEAVGNVQQRLGLDRQFSIPNKPFSSNPICYVAHNTERGNQVMGRINQAIEKLRAAGELEQLVPEGARAATP